MIRSRLNRTPFQSKPKVCKGIGEAKGHGCGTPAKYRKFGLGTDCRCYQKWLIESPEGQKRMNGAILKATRPRIESEASLDKAMHEKKDRTKLQTLLVNVKNVCHEYVRARDKFLPCISCGALWKPDFQCGHFYKSELYSTLRFEEKNLNGQCQGCNLYADGNESGYRVGIMNRYGKELLEKLDYRALAEKKGSHKWDREELEKIRVYYKQKLKNIEKSNT